MLNRYYDMTDHSEIYRIAMGEFDFDVLAFIDLIVLT
jgi:hypothetical protein